MTRVELSEIYPKMLERVTTQRHHSGLIAFADERHMSRRREGEVFKGESGDLTDSGCRLVEEDQQHTISA